MAYSATAAAFVLMCSDAHVMLLWLKPFGLSCNIFISPKIIIKEFKSQKRVFLKWQNLYIYAKINSLYGKMGGTPLYPILKSQTV